MGAFSRCYSCSSLVFSQSFLDFFREASPFKTYFHCLAWFQGIIGRQIPKDVERNFKLKDNMDSLAHLNRLRPKGWPFFLSLKSTFRKDIPFFIHYVPRIDEIRRPLFELLLLKVLQRALFLFHPSDELIRCHLFLFEVDAVHFSLFAFRVKPDCESRVPYRAQVSTIFKHINNVQEVVAVHEGIIRLSFFIRLKSILIPLLV
ncbi:hypothetical protein ES703_97321 [subsurface metagenome]